MNGFFENLICSGTKCPSWILALLCVLAVFYLIVCSFYKKTKAFRIFGHCFICFILCANFIVLIFHICLFSLLSTIFVILLSYIIFDEILPKGNGNIFVNIKKKLKSQSFGCYVISQVSTGGYILSICNIFNKKIANSKEIFSSLKEIRKQVTIFQETGFLAKIEDRTKKFIKEVSNPKIVMQKKGHVYYVSLYQDRTNLLLTTNAIKNRLVCLIVAKQIKRALTSSKVFLSNAQFDLEYEKVVEEEKIRRIEQKYILKEDGLQSKWESFCLKIKTLWKNIKLFFVKLKNKIKKLIQELKFKMAKRKRINEKLKEKKQQRRLEEEKLEILKQDTLAKEEKQKLKRQLAIYRRNEKKIIEHEGQEIRRLEREKELARKRESQKLEKERLEREKLEKELSNIKRQEENRKRREKLKEEKEKSEQFLKEKRKRARQNKVKKQQKIKESKETQSTKVSQDNKKVIVKKKRTTLILNQPNALDIKFEKANTPELIEELEELDVDERNPSKILDWSFEAKYNDSSELIQKWYYAIKSTLLSYGAKETASWKMRKFSKDNINFTKVLFKEKTLNVYLSLNPDDFVESKYIFERAENVEKFSDTPMRLRINSERSLKSAIELISFMMEKNGFEKTFVNLSDFVRENPKNIDSLIKCGLIKEEITFEITDKK